LKSSHKPARKLRLISAVAFVLLLGGIAIVARGEIPEWLQNIQAGTPVENALFRLMSLPGGDVLARRPPREARPLLDKLVDAQPKNADLYSLRAMEEEQQLDFDASEKDWKSYAHAAADRTAAQLALADFYHRRAHPQEEIAALSAVAQSPSAPSENLLAPRQQQSWLAFTRIFTVISSNALPAESSSAQYRAWIARYPRESSLYAQYFEFMLAQKQYDRAADLISAYQKSFPQDAVFPVKAQALLDYRKGNLEQALAVYDRSFQPLWPQTLVQGYFSLLGETHTLRKFLDASRAAHAANPDDLNALAHLFYYYQQQGQPGASQQLIEEFRAHKETAKTPWTSEELYTLARLLEKIQAYPEAARYYYALYNVGPAPENRERALNGLINILLASPEQPIRLGAGDLSMYKDIGTADPGPGFLNGILSLLFNDEDPKASLADEEQRGVPYFHRAEAAKLLALLDQQFPKTPERAPLHARLLQAYVEYGESDTVIARGRDFLAAFPDSPQRTRVSLLMADAYARLGKTGDEFAIYDAVLRELAQKAKGVPLGSAASPAENADQREFHQDDQPNGQDSAAQQEMEESPRAAAAASQALSLVPAETPQPTSPRSASYSGVLERYLSRLAALKQLPQALQILRREVDRNPNDPGLYERLAQFLDQNQLGAQEEEVYKRAIQQFPDRSWYHKLARLYLRHKRNDEFENLSNQVVKIFAGSELESYFDDVVGRSGTFGPQLYLRLNLGASQRFPHDQAFVRNLLSAYSTPGTYDPAAWEKVLRQHWFEDDGLRAEFFEFLSRTHKLDGELAALRAANPEAAADQWAQAAQSNPAAVQFFAEAELWQSHFENAMPALGAIAAEFPADVDLGRRSSTVYRSLAYIDPQNTEAAVRIEQNLLKSDPANRDTLARIGDIYADRDMFKEAAPYWNRMAQIEPGNSSSYLEAATVFWDYYKFDDALRLLNSGRAKLAGPNLFAYEEGAIYESERDYPRAVEEYVKGALADGDSMEAGNRLLSLARRPKFKAAVDRGTAHIADAQNPAIVSIRLRVQVLKAQDRTADIQSFLLALIGRTDSIELVEQLEALAQQEALEDVLQRAIEQEVKLTTDPVRRLEMRYSLVQLFESKKDYAAAQKNIEALYQENPKILGVVRATVDFYWRRKMQQRAIDVLLQAAKDSYPALRDKFDYEAARKSTDAGNFGLARQLLDPLLQQSPYDAELLAAMADTYARAGDSSALRNFYVDKLALFRHAPFAPDERIRRIAELRRGLIPALTQLKDYAGAVDQYIEIINQFPEDADLPAEVALYAEQHALQSRVTAFYAKTVSDSPQDYRWAMVLARLQTQFEDYPAAIASYTKSIAVRPDRVDLYTARADLLERLMRFDEAAADYAKLYSLSYHDPKWALKLAKIRAIESKPDATVAALNSAWIEGRPGSPQNFFAAAQSLESWGMLPQAKELAQRGVDAAGDDLLANSENHAGAKLYVRILTRLRLQQEAYASLDAALQSANTPTTPLSSAVKQMEKQGLAAVTDSEWRDREQKMRATAGAEGMDSCMKEIGATVALYFTPEEKADFSQFLASKQNGAAQDFLIDAAESAGLAPLEARWRYEVLLADPLKPSSHLQRLIELQSRRLKFAELANQLETYAARLPYTSQPYVLMSAADAYRSAGSPSTELRIFSELDARGHLYQNQQRYFELLFAQQPKKLVELAGNTHSRWYEAATVFAISSGDDKLAYDAIRAHGASLPPVWTKAYAGLAGLYFGDPGAPVNASFSDILNDRPIGDRLGKPLDLNRQLAGDTWFYYGSRYGEYLGATHQGNPEDYLPAVLEQSPGSPDTYLITAEYYADAADYPRAVADYQHSLELSPSQAGVRDRVALIYWKSGQRPQAIAEWKKALGILKGAQDPDSSNNFPAIARHLGERKLAAELRPEIDAVLRDYIRRTGSYNAMPLLQAAYASLGDPAAATSWILDLASAAADPTSFLADLVDANWIPLVQREPLYRRILEIQQAEVDKHELADKEGAQLIQRQWQVRWLQYLLETKQFDRAKTELSSLLADTQNLSSGNFIPIELRIAAAQNTLDPILAGYRADPDHAPDFEVLRGAAAAIEAAGQKPAAQRILEFAYSREIERHNLNAANFLGLAEIRLDAGDTRGALDQLNRLVLVVGEPFENLEAAAALLEKSGHPADAAAFLLQFARVSPWQPEVRLRLARAQIAAARDAASENSSSARKDLAAIAAASDVPYDLRARAASTLAGNGSSPALGSDELNLLADGHPISPAQANQPYFSRARLVAASQLLDDHQRIDLLRAILDDSPSSDAARIQLLHAAASTHEYQLAFSAIQPLLNSRLFAPVPENGGQAIAGQADEKQTDATQAITQQVDADQANPEQVNNDQEPPQENAAPAQGESQTPGAASSQSAASNAERLRIAAEVAAVMENLGRLDDAARYLASAEKLERSESRRMEFHRRLLQLRAELARRAANASRAPQIHKELEQARLVRPRLAAQTSAEGSRP
jgi:cellulose synthase operon protein C